MIEKLFRKYKRNCHRFVETGTHTGAGIQAAIDAGFSEACIVTFDVDEEKAARARAKFPRAHIYAKSSPCEEFGCMALSREPALFWLDAHYMGDGGTVGIDYPLINEISVLSLSTTPHVILCDDVRLFDRYGTSVKEIVGTMNKTQKYRHEFATSKPGLPNDVLVLIPEAE